MLAHGVMKGKYCGFRHETRSPALLVAEQATKRALPHEM